MRERLALPQQELQEPERAQQLALPPELPAVVQPEQQVQVSWQALIELLPAEQLVQQQVLLEPQLVP